MLEHVEHLDYHVAANHYQPCQLLHLGRLLHHCGGRQPEVKVEHQYQHNGRQPFISVQRLPVFLPRLVQLHAVVEDIGTPEALHLAQQADGTLQLAGTVAVGLPDALNAWRLQLSHLLHPGGQHLRMNMQLECQSHHFAAVERFHPNGLSQVYLHQQKPVVIVPFRVLCHKHSL